MSVKAGQDRNITPALSPPPTLPILTIPFATVYFPPASICVISPSSAPKKYRKLTHRSRSFFSFLPRLSRSFASHRKPPAKPPSSALLTCPHPFQLPLISSLPLFLFRTLPPLSASQIRSFYPSFSVDSERSSPQSIVSKALYERCHTSLAGPCSGLVVAHLSLTIRFTPYCC